MAVSDLRKELFPRMYLNRRFAALAALVLVGCASLVITSNVRAADGVQQDLSRLAIPIFRGDLGPDANVSVSGWGSGSGEASRDVPALVGTSAIKVTTMGMYQGVRLDFKRPVDLANAFRSNKTYMRFQVRFTGAGASVSTFDPQGFQPVTRAASPFQKMRFLLVMEDGTQYELVRPVEVPPSDDPDQWVPMAFPLNAITKQLPAGKTLTGAGAQLKQIAVFGDKYETFYIGEINVLVDETELSVAPLDDQIIFALQPITFVGSADGGASTVRFSWDFDSRDGIQEDAVGRTVTYAFPRSGQQSGQKKYTITLTISDVDGMKKPVSTTLEVEVTD
jgi:hypothetical protein